MEEIKLYKFSPDTRPLNERLDILHFKNQEPDIIEHAIYKEAYYCFLLLEKGEAEIILDNQRAKVKAPVVICGLPGDTWKWIYWKDVEGRFICFDAETLMSGLKGGFSLDPIPFLNPEKRYPFVPLSDDRFRRLKLLVDDMEEARFDFPIHYDLLRAELWQFVFLTEKEYSLNGNTGRTKEQKNRLLQFIQLVNLNYTDHHDAQFYADAMHITPNYLNKITNAMLGLSAYDYITNRIISEAKILLRLTNINISELAYKLGYENPGYFIRLFKKKEGITPLEYHKRGTL